MPDRPGRREAAGCHSGQIVTAFGLRNEKPRSCCVGRRPGQWVWGRPDDTMAGGDMVSRHTRPKETEGRIAALERFFGDKMLSDVTGETCRAYVAQRTTDAAARRELEDLRAAINHHRREGLCNKVVEVAL